MAAVRRGFCDSRAGRGKGTWVRVGLPLGGGAQKLRNFRGGHLTTAKSRKRIGAPRS